MVMRFNITCPSITTSSPLFTPSSLDLFPLCNYPYDNKNAPELAIILLFETIIPKISAANTVHKHSVRYAIIRLQTLDIATRGIPGGEI